MKTQHLTEIVCPTRDDSCIIVLYYALELTGTNFVPVLLYYVNIVANMSKNSFLSHFHAPFEAKSGAKL